MKGMSNGVKCANREWVKEKNISQGHVNCTIARDEEKKFEEKKKYIKSSKTKHNQIDQVQRY